MRATARRSVAVVLVCVLTLACSVAARVQTPAPATPTTSVPFTPEEMRVFLREARITRSRRSSKGVTDTRVATLSDGRVTHDAQIQDVDEYRALFQAGAKSEVNFKDSYKFNIAGYELARLIGLNNVPMSVERTVEGKKAAMTWWLDDLLVIDGQVIDEEVRVKKKIRPPDSLRFSRQIQIMSIFDELIQNVDRNQGNAMWDKTWKLWMVDHTRGFRLGRELKKPVDLVSCERGLLEALRRLTGEALATAVGANLTKQEVEAVLTRRDLIVKHYDTRIAERGEENVLFTLASETASQAAQ
jgi:hypothetical protein